MSDKGLITRTYKGAQKTKLTHTHTHTHTHINEQMKKWATELGRNFSKEEDKGLNNT
jgi:hypothetical protein